MTSEMVASLILAASTVLVVAFVCGTALVAWRGWLGLKRLEIQTARSGKSDEPTVGDMEDTGALIELAAVKERLRRLEAIANGVEL